MSKECPVCAKEFIPWSRAQVRCSDACTGKRSRPGRNRKINGVCKWCTKPFTQTRRGTNGTGRYCSRTCGRSAVGLVEREALALVRIASGQSTHMGKRRLALLQGERVNLVSILERDGWKCQICGIDTPKELRGTKKPNAPEVDHINPIARGGRHTRSNLQCACKACNIRKGARWGVVPHARGVSTYHALSAFLQLLHPVMAWLA